jgi:integrase/recombinase XerC
MGHYHCLMTTAEVIATFNDYQRGRGFSLATVNRRGVSLRGLAAHIAPLTLVDATPELIEEYVYSRKSLATRHAYRADLSAFYTWAQRRGLCATNPVDLVDPVKMPKQLPRPIPAEQVAPLIASAPQRVGLMIGLAAYAGLRRAEIAHLQHEDIMRHVAPAVIVVRNGKGGKDRVVPIHPALLKLLPAWGAGSVFELSPAHVGRLVTAHLRACGVGASPHALRHTFGTEAARAAHGDLLLVADLMGHGSPSTTMGYTKLVGRDTAATVAAMFGAVA